jgi:aminoglycoside phosphotransferase (APT) family kinase protein
MDPKEVLYRSGFDPQFIAAGMEGFVFDIGNALLAKVWIKKSYGEVAQLRSFYSQLREKHLPFATPRIHEVLESQDGSVISIEDRLSGVSIKSILEGSSADEVLYKKGMDAVVMVVESLGAIGDIPVTRELSLLGERSLWTPNSTWNTVLGEIVNLRANRYKAVLEKSVRNFEQKVTRLVALLNALHISRVGVVHGDICPENVLVDEATTTPISLLDFGFLTTSADPFFDAIISILIFDMYSPHRQKARESLWNRYSQNLGQPFRDIYPLYKAAYALMTSNAYSEDGNDGHFRWCVDILNDEETRKALL